jgi:sigma-B regulation protein RsbU (phosphoserine phosphatase)
MVDQDFGPAEILQRLNRFLAQDSLRGHFITACCLRLDAAEGHIRLASAGHEPPLLLRAGGATREVPMPGGLPLGLGTLVVATGYRESEFTLQPGERLIVFTDGLTDTRNEEGEVFGSDRALQYYAEGFEGEEIELLDGLYRAMDAFRGRTPWVDDLTVLTLHRKETERN